MGIFRFILFCTRGVPAGEICFFQKVLFFEPAGYLRFWVLNIFRNMLPLRNYGDDDGDDDDDADYIEDDVVVFVVKGKREGVRGGEPSASDQIMSIDLVVYVVTRKCYYLSSFVRLAA